MENQITNTSKAGISELMKNTNIDIRMEGWPASAAIIVGFLSITVMYGLKVYAGKNVEIETDMAA